MQINPLMGRFSRHVKTMRSNLAKNALEPKGLPRKTEEGLRTDENPLKAPNRPL
jgi:hypothetical protein